MKNPIDVFYMCWIEGESTPVLKNYDLDLAEIEAKILAKKTNKKVFILSTFKTVEIQEFTVLDARPSEAMDIPF